MDPWGNQTRLNYDPCAARQDVYQSVKPLKYYTATPFCIPYNVSCGRIGYTPIGNFSGVHNPADTDVWGNVDANSDLRYKPTRLNELTSEYTLPVATSPYTGRADAFQQKVPIDNEWLHYQLGTKEKKSINVSSGMETGAFSFQLLPCDPAQYPPTIVGPGEYGCPTRVERRQLSMASER